MEDVNEKNEVRAGELHERDGILWPAFDEVRLPLQVKAQDLGVKLCDGLVRSIRVLAVDEPSGGGYVGPGVDIVHALGFGGRVMVVVGVAPRWEVA